MYFVARYAFLWCSISLSLVLHVCVFGGTCLVLYHMMPRVLYCITYRHICLVLLYHIQAHVSCTVSHTGTCAVWYHSASLSLMLHLLAFMLHLLALILHFFPVMLMLFFFRAHSLYCITRHPFLFLPLSVFFPTCLSLWCCKVLCGVWCIACALCGVFHVHCVVCGVWCIACALCGVLHVHCVVCGVWCIACAMCGVWCIACAMCGLWCIASRVIFFSFCCTDVPFFV